MKVLGISDEITICEKCAKTNLKKTVVLDTGEGTVHYGTTCAAKEMKIKVSSLKIEVDVLSKVNEFRGNHSDENIAQWVWNKFGFYAEVKNGKIRIKMTEWVEV